MRVRRKMNTYKSKFAWMALVVVTLVTPTMDCMRLGIVNGVTARKGEFPYFVRIMVLSISAAMCDGALVDEYTVLTAAHCTDPNLEKAYNVTLGLNIPDVKPLSILARGLAHPQFNQPGHLKNDVAVLKFDEPVPEDYRQVTIIKTTSRKVFKQIHSLLKEVCQNHQRLR